MTRLPSCHLASSAKNTVRSLTCLSSFTSGRHTLDHSTWCPGAISGKLSGHDVDEDSRQEVLYFALCTHRSCYHLVRLQLTQTAKPSLTIQHLRPIISMPHVVPNIVFECCVRNGFALLFVHYCRNFHRLQLTCLLVNSVLSRKPS